MAKANTTIDLTGLQSIDESSTTLSKNGKWLIQKSEKYTSGDTKYLQRTVFVDLTGKEQGFIDAVSQGIIEIVTK